MEVMVNRQSIKASSQKSYLIKIPRSNKAFWFPISMTESRGGMVCLRTFEGMTILVMGKGGSKKEPACLISDWFDMIPANQNDDCYLKVREPRKLEREVTVPNELRNDR